MTPERIGSFKFKGEELHVYTSTYQEDGSLAIFIYDDTGQPFCTVSENHGLKLRPGHFVVQARNMSIDLRLTLLTCGLFEDTRRVHSDGSDLIEPIWRLKPRQPS